MCFVHVKKSERPIFFLGIAVDSWLVAKEMIWQS